MTVIEFPRSTRVSEQIGRYRFDPLGFVMFAFPWGRPGTSLANETGPEPWQREVLGKLGRGLKQRDGLAEEAVRLAVASGHGIGKSAVTTPRVSDRVDIAHRIIQEKPALRKRRYL